MNTHSLNTYGSDPWHGSITYDQSPGDDKRSQPRQRSVFRVARVSVAGEEGFARVLNISDEGLMLAIQLRIAPGADLQIDLSEAIRLKGKVVWRDGQNCGVQLAYPIDSAATLVRLFADSVRGGDRPLRLHCSTEAIARGEFGTRKVQIENISLRGLMVRHDGSFQEGLRVKVLLGVIGEREGIVRWSQEGQAGISLLTPLSLHDLGSTGKLGGARG
jgi:hypothetical protein